VATFWQSSIASFVLSGDPNNEHSPKWPSYDLEDPQLMNVGKASQWLVPNYRVSVGTDHLDRVKCDYWQTAPFYTPPSLEVEGHLIEQTDYIRNVM